MDKMLNSVADSHSCRELLAHLGIPESVNGGDLAVTTPIDGSVLGQLQTDTAATAADKVERAVSAFGQWREVPAPRRGELIRLLAEELRAEKDALGRLVSLECGKILQEGWGEVQEMIDICDFAVGLSRQLYGLTIASERPGHRMFESWHPLGPAAVITAFNFPVAVAAWNFALALVCGDSVLWKPSEKTPLCALACLKLFERAAARLPGGAPQDLLQLVIGGRELSEQLAVDARLPLVSATGSCAMGAALGPRVAARFGRTILELGGNNAVVVAPSADLELALRAIVFGAVGTAGQRCTSTRRLIVQRDRHGTLVQRLQSAYRGIRIGNPLDPDNLVGPLIDSHGFKAMQEALVQARAEGGAVFGGERVLQAEFPGAYYVQPAIVEMPAQSELVCRETFAPILYVLDYGELDEAIALHNAVPQGLSSAIFTGELGEAERFLAASGSDCGIVNVNIGTSGAEIGGAFGGEKATGGGRESGSDAWKGYMRRMTSTVSYSSELPLAQGISFDLPD